MSENIDIILIVSALVVLYFYIQDLNNNKSNNKNIKKAIEDKPKTKTIPVTNPVPNKIKENITNSNTIKFNYKELRPIEKQFLYEQEHGVTFGTFVPNNAIIETSTDKGITEKLEDTTENFIESKARFTYEFNEPKILQMNGVADPTDFKDGKGVSLKEVYDNYYVNYKNLIPKKEVINKDDKIMTEGSGAFNGDYKSFASSNIAYYLPDTWTYYNEKPENGGKFDNGLLASDPYQVDAHIATVDF